MISTIYGDMDASELELKEGVYEDEYEVASWLEYWLKGELVHRSAHVDLKHSISVTSTLEAF